MDSCVMQKHVPPYTCQKLQEPAGHSCWLSRFPSCLGWTGLVVRVCVNEDGGQFSLMFSRGEFGVRVS